MGWKAVSLVVVAVVHGIFPKVNAERRESVEHRMETAIRLLELVLQERLSLEHLQQQPGALSTAVGILHSVKEDLANIKERRLEGGGGEENQKDDNDDDDDYISESWYYIYSNRDDVSVVYDEEDYTIVTVDEDVIVIVEHTWRHYLLNGLMAGLCVVFGSLMAGLLMGVMTLDPLLLSVKARTAETEEERTRVGRLLPFVQNKNLVLVSVILANCAVNEALPIFLHQLIENAAVVILLSVVLVVLVGEILPSAYFTGKDQVKSASHLIPVLRVVIILLSPISYPLAKLMDKYFENEEGSAFKRGELSALVRIQYEEKLARKQRQAYAGLKEQLVPPDSSSSSKPTYCNQHCNWMAPLECIMKDPVVDLTLCKDKFSGPQDHHQDDVEIEEDDINWVEGALNLKHKQVKQAFTPLNCVVSVTANSLIDEHTMVQLYSHGFSRIPVFDTDERGHSGICGILLMKQLILVKEEDRRRVSTMTLYEPPCVSPGASMATAFNIIQAGKGKSSNMALVCMDPDRASAALKAKKPVPLDAGVMGIITLENVLEELLQEQIYDEKDKKTNPSMERARWAVAKWMAFVLRRRLERESQDSDEISFGYARMGELA